MLILAIVINTATVSTLYILFFSCVDIFCPTNNKPELMLEYMSLNRAPLLYPRTSNNTVYSKCISLSLWDTHFPSHL